MFKAIFDGVSVYCEEFRAFIKATYHIQLNERLNENFHNYIAGQKFELTICELEKTKKIPVKIQSIPQTAKNRLKWNYIDVIEIWFCKEIASNFSRKLSFSASSFALF